ncbi:hypothetical protein THTE_3005 [Thermogutta terrifontis]|uniref:Uncharacterized protein n=1 Tax=Thermogutta terrifontis TaxID=1331910 RepID=A0A286RI25_9BACT|nr:hypothetical protein THTE_3005 [Thermogutta terrifontis]
MRMDENSRLILPGRLLSAGVHTQNSAHSATDRTRRADSKRMTGLPQVAGNWQLARFFAEVCHGGGEVRLPPFWFLV